MGNPSHIFQLKQKDLRRENKRIGVAVEDTEEKSGECDEGILPVRGSEHGLPRCRGCSIPWDYNYFCQSFGRFRKSVRFEEVS